jgi:hypothetical protein
MASPPANQWAGPTASNQYRITSSTQIGSTHQPAGISFEHAWFLLLAIARHDEVGIARCGTCGGVRVRDLLARHKLACGNCDGAMDSAAPRAPC